jgi:hypothetical protein
MWESVLISPILGGCFALILLVEARLLGIETPEQFTWVLASGLLGMVAGFLLLRYGLVAPSFALLTTLGVILLAPHQLETVSSYSYSLAAGGTSILLLLGGGEYTIRRLAGYLQYQFDPGVERAMALGVLAGLIYVALLAIALPEFSLDRQSIFGDSSMGLFKLVSLGYFIGGLGLTAAIPVALFVRFRVLSPLILFGLDQVFWLVLQSDTGEARGPIAIFLWPLLLIVFITVGFLEYLIRFRSGIQ